MKYLYKITSFTILFLFSQLIFYLSFSKISFMFIDENATIIFIRKNDTYIFLYFFSPFAYIDFRINGQNRRKKD